MSAAGAGGGILRVPLELLLPQQVALGDDAGQIQSPLIAAGSPVRTAAMALLAIRRPVGEVLL